MSENNSTYDRLYVNSLIYDKIEMGFKTQYFHDDMCMSVMYTMCRYIDLLLVLLLSRVGQCLLESFDFSFYIEKENYLFLCDND
jgi:hypothetical protein